MSFTRPKSTANPVKNKPGSRSKGSSLQRTIEEAKAAASATMAESNPLMRPVKSSSSDFLTISSLLTGNSRASSGLSTASISGTVVYGDTLSQYSYQANTMQLDTSNDGDDTQGAQNSSASLLSSLPSSTTSTALPAIMAKKPSPIRSYSTFPITLPGSHCDLANAQLNKVLIAMIRSLATSPPPPTTLLSSPLSSLSPRSPFLSSSTPASSHPWLPPLGLFSLLPPAAPPDHAFTGSERDPTASTLTDSTLHQLLLHVSLEDLPAQTSVRLDHRLFVALYVLPPADLDVAAVVARVRGEQVAMHREEIERLEREIAEYNAREEDSRNSGNDHFPAIVFGDSGAKINKDLMLRKDAVPSSATATNSAESRSNRKNPESTYISDRVARVTLLKQILAVADAMPIPSGPESGKHNSQPIPIFLGRSDVVRNTLCPRFQPGFAFPYLPSWHVRVRADVYCQRDTGASGYALVATATAPLCQVLSAPSRLLRVPALVSDTFASDADHAGPRCSLRSAYGGGNQSALASLGSERVAALQALSSQTRAAHTPAPSPGSNSTGAGTDAGAGAGMDDKAQAIAAVAAVRTSLLAPSSGRAARQSRMFTGRSVFQGNLQNPEVSGNLKSPRSLPWGIPTENPENNPMLSVVDSWNAQTATGDYAYHPPAPRHGELPTQLCTIVFEVRSPPFPPLPTSHPDCVHAYTHAHTHSHTQTPTQTQAPCQGHVRMNMAASSSSSSLSLSSASASAAAVSARGGLPSHRDGPLASSGSGSVGISGGRGDIGGSMSSRGAPIPNAGVGAGTNVGMGVGVAADASLSHAMSSLSLHASNNANTNTNTHTAAGAGVGMGAGVGAAAPALSARDKYTRMLQRPRGSRTRSTHGDGEMHARGRGNAPVPVPALVWPLDMGKVHADMARSGTVDSAMAQVRTPGRDRSGNSPLLSGKFDIANQRNQEIPERGFSSPPSSPRPSTSSHAHTHAHAHGHAVPHELQELIDTARKSLPLRKKSVPEISFLNPEPVSARASSRPSQPRPLSRAHHTHAANGSGLSMGTGMDMSTGSRSGSPVSHGLGSPTGQAENLDNGSIYDLDDNLDDDDDNVEPRELTAQERALFSSPLGSFLWQLFQAKLSDPDTAASASAARALARAQAATTSVTHPVALHSDERVANLLLRARAVRFMRSVARSCAEGQLLLAGKAIGPRGAQLIADWLLCESVELQARQAREARRGRHQRTASLMLLGMGEGEAPDGAASVKDGAGATGSLAGSGSGAASSSGSNSVGGGPSSDAGDADVAAAALSTGVLPCTSINLSHNHIQDDGLRALAEALRTHTGVRAVSLVGTGSVAYTGTGNNEGGTGLCALLDALGGDRAIVSRLLGPAATQTTALPSSNNANNSAAGHTSTGMVGAAGASSLASPSFSTSSLSHTATSAPPSLLYVDPKLWPVRTGALTRVNYLLAQHRHAHQAATQAENSHYTASSHYTALSSYPAALADRSLASWSLAYNTSITTLDISGGVPSHVPLLVRVPGSACGGGGLGISQLGQGGLKALGRMLMVNDSISELGIRNTGIGLIPGGMELLAVGLSVNRGLRVLDLADNRLGPTHMQQLCQSLLTRAGRGGRGGRGGVGGRSDGRDGSGSGGSGSGSGRDGAARGGHGDHGNIASRPLTRDGTAPAAAAGVGAGIGVGVGAGLGVSMLSPFASQSSTPAPDVPVHSHAHGNATDGNSTNTTAGAGAAASTSAGASAGMDAESADSSARAAWAEDSLAQLEADEDTAAAIPHPVLQSLSLACNPLKDEGVATVAQWARHASGLHVLDLSSVEVGGAGFVSVLRMLSDAQCTVRVLSVNNNKLHMGGSALMEAVRAAGGLIADGDAEAAGEAVAEGAAVPQLAALTANGWTLRAADAATSNAGKSGKEGALSTPKKSAPQRSPAASPKAVLHDSKNADESELKGTPSRAKPRKSPKNDSGKPTRGERRGRDAKSGQMGSKSRHRDSISSSELLFESSQALFSADATLTKTLSSVANANSENLAVRNTQTRNSVPAPLPPLSLSLNANLEYLSLCSCGIDDVFVKHLSRTISTVSSLHTLVLADNRIRCDGAVSLSHWLLRAREAPHCTLTKLDLSGNAIGDRGGAAIGAAVAVNTRLTTLRLENNHLGVGAACALLTALTRNQTLVTCNVSSNRIPYELYKRLTALAKRNRTLREAGAVAQLYQKILTLASENARIPKIISEARQLRTRAHALEEELQRARRQLAETQVHEPRQADGLLRELHEKRAQRVREVQQLGSMFPDDPNMVIPVSAPSGGYGKYGGGGMGVGTGMTMGMSMSMGVGTGYSDLDGIGTGRSVDGGRRDGAGLLSTSSSSSLTAGNAGGAGVSSVAVRGVVDNLIAERQASIAAKKQLQQAYGDVHSFHLLLQGVQMKMELQTPSLSDLDGLFGDDDDAPQHPTIALNGAALPAPSSTNAATTAATASASASASTAASVSLTRVPEESATSTDTHTTSTAPSTDATASLSSASPATANARDMFSSSAALPALRVDTDADADYETSTDEYA